MADSSTSVPHPAEKRSEIRIPCSLKALYHPRSEPALFTRWGTCICNVSKNGIGLVLPLRLKRRTRLVVELPAGNGHDSCTLEVETVRSQRQPDGNWIHGCVPVGHDRPEQTVANPVQRARNGPAPRPDNEPRARR